MRISRNKGYRRIMRFFRIKFGIQDPYHILVDGTFLTHSLQQKIYVKEQLPKVVQGRATPMVTSCVLAELRSLGQRALGAAIIAKGYYNVKCGHETPIGASRCIMEQIGAHNERKFLVATQDMELVKALREIPSVPVIRLNVGVPVLEEPSFATRAAADAGEAQKLEPATWEHQKLPALQERKLQAAAAAAAPKKKRKQKAPNPLSCLKPRKRALGDAAPAPSAEEPRKAKRVRSRVMGTVTKAAAEARLHGDTDGAPAAAREAAREQTSDGGKPVEPAVRCRPRATSAGAACGRPRRRVRRRKG